LYFRRQRRRPTELIEDSLELRALLDSIPALLDDPERDLLRREVGRLVHVSLDQLPRHYGDPLRWKYADGLSVKEIASRLDVTPKAAESLMTRARRAFRKVFSSLGGAFADQFIDSECSS